MPTPDADGTLFRRDPDGQLLRVLAAGDVSFSGRIAEICERAPSEPLGALGEEFGDADIVFFNLETVLRAEDGQPGMFASRPGALRCVPGAPIRIVSIANNHVRDYGAEGLRSTVDALTGAGFVPIGVAETLDAASVPTYVTARGMSMAWFACARTLEAQTDGPPYFWEYDEEALLDAVRRHRPRADLVAVSIHTGYMYVDVPHPDVKAFAERLTDAGADLVLMHHAHILQGYDVRNSSRLIAYNLGNLLFDWTEGNVDAQLMTEEQREGALFAIDCDRAGVAALRALPTWIDDALRVEIAGASRRARILGRLGRVTALLQGDVREAFASQRASRNTGIIARVVWHHVRRGNLRYVLEQVRKIRPSHAAMVARWVANRLRRPRV